jgi:hypothetical protein
MFPLLAWLLLQHLGPSDFPSNLRQEARRHWLRSLFTGAVVATASVTATSAQALPLQESLDIDTFLRTGVDIGGNMGVSSQAGKSKPITGVVFRDGSDVSQDRNGSVAAEILTGKDNKNFKPILISFTSPWKLETGSNFDIECRNGKTGDGVFVAVTSPVNGKTIDNVSDSFLLERLFSPTGRFSFYGPPTDIKIKKTTTMENRRYMEVSFSTLSQSTNAEIPRTAALVAILPENTENAILLVGSTSSNRWKTVREEIQNTLDSFQAIPAPETQLKVRSKNRNRGSLDF